MKSLLLSGVAGRLGVTVTLVGLLSLMTVVHASLDVAPTRITLADGERAASVMVVNRSDEVQTFRVVVADTEEFEEGGRRLLSEPGEGGHHAAAMLRHSPRQATLQPGERQVVRLQARRPAELAEGEYRARLAVQTLPRARPPRADSGGGTEGGIELDIQVLFAVTLPVAIFQGSPEARTTIAGARVTDEGLMVELERQGRRSSYGRLVLYAGDRAEGSSLARLERAVVVVPLERRVFRFRDVEIEPGSQLHVVYEGIGERAGEIKAVRTVVVE